MQNNQNSFYVIKSNVINIKSELLYREAEDDFFYFNKINSALRKLNTAIKLTPSHLKSLKLLADIYFMKGNFKKALNLYLSAQGIKDDFKSLAGIANCCFAMGKYDNAVNYVDMIIESVRTQNIALYSQLLEIKINSLVKLKQYKRAYDTYVKSKIFADENSLKSIYDNYELIREKISLQKRLNEVKLKIV